MNPRLVRSAASFAIGLAGSIVIGYIIKGERQLIEKIGERFPTPELPNPLEK